MEIFDTIIGSGGLIRQLGIAFFLIILFVWVSLNGMAHFKLMVKGDVKFEEIIPSMIMLSALLIVGIVATLYI